MSRPAKILTWISISIIGLILIVVIGGIIVLRTEWFRNYVREKIISSVEDSTGGKVELKTFTFDWPGLTATVTGFVLHGTEPPGSAPLFEAPSIVLRLKLFAGFKKAVDLQYLGVDHPAANVMVLPTGETNIPTPKVAKKPSGKSGLETVVDLAIHKVDIRDGNIQYLDQKIAFSVRGQDLRVELLFDPIATRYQGTVSMNPIYLTSGSRIPLQARFTIPVELEKDKIQVTNAKIETPESNLTLTGALRHLASPEISGQLNAHISLAEVTRSVDLPIHPSKGRGPQTVDAVAAIFGNQIQNASVTLGKTHLEASGSVSNGADFHGSLSLDELGQLLQLAEEPKGTVLVTGKVILPRESGYLVTGNIDARDVSFREGGSRLSGIRMTSEVRVDPKAIAVDDLRLFALGGEITADARIEDLERFTLNGNLRGIAIQNLTAALLSKRVGYASVISGNVRAQGAFKTPSAQARLTFTPAGAGVPVSGQINASYSGNTNIISLHNSQIKMPNTSIDLAGEPGRQAEIRMTSRNLNDFFPVLAILSPTANEMPISLRGGGVTTLVTDITGPLASPRVAGRLSVTSFAVSQRSFDQLAADFSASSSEAKVPNASLNRNGSQAQFSASVGLHNWSTEPGSPLTANATIQNGDLADILALAGKSDIRVAGPLNADVRIAGTVANPQGSAQLRVINGTAYDEPFDRLQVLVDLSDQLVNLKSVELTAGAARIDLQGTFNHPRDNFEAGRIQLHLASNQVNLNQFKTLQKERPGFAGIVNLNADLSGDLGDSAGKLEFLPAVINADIKATGVRDRGQSYGNLTVTARTAGSDVNARVDSDFAGSTIQATSRTHLAQGYPTTADATIRNLQIEKVLALAESGSQLPAAGTLSLTAHATGTLDDPRANLTFDLRQATLYDEPVDRVNGTLDYTNQLVNISSLQVTSPAGRIDLKGSLAHARSDYKNGRVELHLGSQGIDLRRLETIQKSKPGVAGGVRLTADVAADLRVENGEQQVWPSRFDVTGGITGIQWNKQSFGNVTFQGETKANVISVKLDSDFAKSVIHGAADIRLHGDFPAEGKLTFANVTYGQLEGFLGSQPEVRPHFDALVEGQLSFNGLLKQPKTLRSDLQLARLEVYTIATSGANRNNKVTILKNQGPMVAHLDRSVVRVENARLTGQATDIAIDGTAGLNKNSALNLTVNAQTDLSLLKDFLENVYSAGNVVVNSTIRGTLSDPRANGRIELKDASLHLLDFSNGISKANGEILLNGTSATIRTLTGESGGGKISVSGFTGFTGGTLNYSIRANANEVRTRYAGASVVTNASITLSGTSERSTLGGTVTIQRVTYNQQSDFGSILSGAATPPAAPSAPVGPIAGMRLNIRIQTAPDVRFQTTLAQGLSATADLRLLGTLASPGMAGRVDITGGNLVFFGNKYTVNRGSISFYDAQHIEPILDIDLETSVKGVEVVLGVSGPIENMKLTYRSDPPLKFEDIIALLATGRTPPDATIAARQPARPGQSVTQMGESAILGQAANPVANSLSRVFGVSQLKIDPAFYSGSALPTARVTVQQQVSPTLTFTYTQDLTQTNSQIIKVEWELTPRFSAVATRDENGIFGVDFFYKKQFR